jgi:hypothetical protein
MLEFLFSKRCEDRTKRNPKKWLSEAFAAAKEAKRCADFRTANVIWAVICYLHAAGHSFDGLVLRIEIEIDDQNAQTGNGEHDLIALVFGDHRLTLPAPFLWAANSEDYPPIPAGRTINMIVHMNARLWFEKGPRVMRMRGGERLSGPIASRPELLDAIGISHGIAETAMNELFDRRRVELDHLERRFPAVHVSAT